MNQLAAIRAFVKGKKKLTKGLSDAVLKRFERDPQLISALTQAQTKHRALQASMHDTMKLDEADCVQAVQRGFLNFYDPSSLYPFVGLAAQGPWIVTAHGAVIYDTGGYGMLAFGHNPPQVLNALAQPQIMANIMTPSFSQAQFHDRLRTEVGQNRPNGECPYERFVCLNSGSECMSLAMRIMDVDSARMIGPDGPHPGRQPLLISLQGSFHGRTDRPAMASDSCQESYKKHLASFQDQHSMRLRTVEPNNVQMLQDVFGEADKSNFHVEGMLMEPVMGEGNPGLAITREFYDEARRLTDEYRSLLVVDSIQAGVRAHGVLSVMDYPGFEDAAPPDFETYSKAIMAGQFPLSVLALGPRVPEIYPIGLYGNTMTTNPRALDVASSVLDEFTPELRQNIKNMGKYFVEQLRELQVRHPNAVADVSGTGLLVACHLQPGWKAFGDGSVEQLCRQRGLGVIHGGKNALRFTPNFTVTPLEIDLIVECLEDAFKVYGKTL